MLEEKLKDSDHKQKKLEKTIKNIDSIIKKTRNQNMDQKWRKFAKWTIFGNKETGEL